VQLTDEQVEAARAQGCRFVEATEAQVRQFSMQRRVFQIGDKPYLATREDGFYETAGTLMARIAEVMKRRKAAAPEPEAQEAAAEPAEEAPPPAEVPEARETSAPDKAPEAEEAVPSDEVTEEEEEEEEEAAVPKAREAAAPDEVLEAEEAVASDEVTEEVAPPEAAEPLLATSAREAPPVAPLQAAAPATSVDRSSTVLTAMKTIAKGYARGHQVDAAQLSTLLTTVHRTLSGLEASRPRHPRSGPG
jgi:outer membrane biosynthesis protein TonB